MPADGEHQPPAMLLQMSLRAHLPTLGSAERVEEPPPPLNKA